MGAPPVCPAPRGIERGLTLQPPVNKNLFLPDSAAGLESLPMSLPEAISAARGSALLQQVLPDGLAERYFDEQERRCAELAQAADPAEWERSRYFLSV